MQGMTNHKRKHTKENAALRQLRRRQADTATLSMPSYNQLISDAPTSSGAHGSTQTSQDPSPTPGGTNTSITHDEEVTAADCHIDDNGGPSDGDLLVDTNIPHPDRPTLLLITR